MVAVRGIGRGGGSLGPPIAKGTGYAFGGGAATAATTTLRTTTFSASFAAGDFAVG